MIRFRIMLEGEVPDIQRPQGFDILPVWDEKFLIKQINQALNSFMYLDKFKVTKIERMDSELEQRLSEGIGFNNESPIGKGTSVTIKFKDPRNADTIEMDCGCSKDISGEWLPCEKHLYLEEMADE